MPTSPHKDTKIVFIIDNDYGELTMAMLFLHGQELAKRTTILLPPRLYATNADSLGVQTHQYSSYANLIDTIEPRSPDLVIFFSAYLVPVHNLLTAQSLAMLIEWLKTRGCHVATFDPFWGLMATPRAAFSEHLKTGQLFELIRYLKFLAAVALRPGQNLRFDPGHVGTFVKVADLLKGILHVVPAPLASEELLITSFWNPQLLGEGWRPGDGEPDDPVSDATDGPYWLFTISQLDYRLQHAKSGHGSAFVDRTAETLLQALPLGRSAVFLGPDDCVTALGEKLSGVDGIRLLTFCPFRQFMRMTMEAEYTFYWNTMTSSSLIRWVNGLPVIFFDKGHVAKDMTPVYLKMRQSLYQGWDPVCLDQSQKLSLQALSDHRGLCRAVSARMLEHLRRAPSPSEMVAQALTVE